jgi:hypothetical protein
MEEDCKTYKSSAKDRERASLWRIKNRERAREASRLYYAENKERLCEYQKQYRAQHAEAIDERNGRWRVLNGDKVREYKRRYREQNESALRMDSRERKRKLRAENPEAAREPLRRWRAANPDANRAHHEKRRVYRSPVPGHHTHDDIENLHRKQEGRCASCGATLERDGKPWYQVDHIIPVTPRNGGATGTNEASNLQLLCPPCNQFKSNLSPEKWAERLAYVS